MLFKENINADLCVVGAGLAGMCTAIAAARKGVKTVIIHDRPSPGGNASSEVRMWVCGARGKNMRETGIVEELLLENLYRNPNAVPAIWDSVLYGALEYEKNITLLLNCACNAAQTDSNGRIIAVSGYQMTTQKTFEVTADYFADCSGDSVLAPLVNAEFRHGREARSEFDESIEPEHTDKCTMGNSCLFQARELDKKVKFIPPVWAKKFRKEEDIPPFRGTKLEGLENFWWMETGGLGDTISDTEENRHELLEIAFGIWDYVKNYSPDKENNVNWELDWVGFLPGKRESRRYVGDYIMNQRDVEGEGKFDDLIAYGGWSMDDHHPAGFYNPGVPTIFHPAPSPYGIPYRSLYSVNVPNLFFAGRNISVSHAALSSTRVMATCALIGQAAGNAAAIAVREKISPREVGEKFIKELQQQLIDQDCYLPGFKRNIPELSRNAELSASNGNDPEPLRNGNDRIINDNINAWEAEIGNYAEYRFDDVKKINAIRLVLDSDLSRPEKNIVALRTLHHPEFKMPATLVKDFEISYQTADGQWCVLEKIENNYRRLLKWDGLNMDAKAVRLTVNGTYGDKIVKIFSWDIA